MQRTRTLSLILLAFTAACTVSGCGGDDETLFEEAGGTAGQGGRTGAAGSGGRGGSSGGKAGSGGAGGSGVGGTTTGPGGAAGAAGAAVDAGEGAKDAAMTSDVSVEDAREAQAPEASVDAASDVGIEGSADVSVESAADVSAEASADVSAESTTDGEGSAAEDVAVETSADVEPGTDDASSVDAENEAGDRDAATPVPLNVCRDTCNTNADCTNPLAPKTWSCDMTTHRCTQCYDDLICIANLSKWLNKTCTSDANCNPEASFPFGDYCVDINGTGRCAFDKNNAARCSDKPTAMLLNKYGSAEKVEVCSNQLTRCDLRRGICNNKCTDSVGCTASRGGRVCNQALGRCECNSNTDCVGGDMPTCNLMTKQCECGSGTDCAAFDSGRASVCE